MRLLSIDVGLRNLAYALIDFNEDPGNRQWSDLNLVAWENVDVLTEGGCEAKNSKNVPVDRCIKLAFAALEKRPHLLQCDRILVEKQMKKSPRNLMIGVALLSYFLLKVPDVPVEFITATGKMKVNMDTQHSFVFSSATPPQTHHVNDPKLSASQNKTRRKNKAVALCDQVLLLPQFAEWKRKYHDKKFYLTKQNDLADCFLQAIYFLQTKYQIRAPRKRKLNPEPKTQQQKKKPKPKQTTVTEEEDEEEQSE